MKLKKYIVLGIIIAIVFIIIYIDDTWISISNITVASDRIPKEFNNFKIVQISDLHNATFGKGQKQLLGKIKTVNPDCIVITGDFIDRRTFDIKPITELLDGISKEVPIYFVTGNHEISTSKYKELKKVLIDRNVHVLEDTYSIIRRKNEKIYLMGVNDYSNYGNNIDEFKRVLRSLSTQTREYKILLSHRPELIDEYEECNFDLVFSGHAHGGQIRIPFVGGLYAPNQGLFPKYTSGMYTKGNTNLIVSRGLGNSSVPIRLFNRPDLVVVTLKSDN